MTKSTQSLTPVECLDVLTCRYCGQEAVSRRSNDDDLCASHTVTATISAYETTERPVLYPGKTWGNI